MASCEFFVSMRTMAKLPKTLPVSDSSTGNSEGSGSRTRRMAVGLLPPVAIAVVLLLAGAPYLRILSLDFRTLGESYRGMVAPVGWDSPENDVQIAYDPDREPELINGLHFTYEHCGGEINYVPPIFQDAWIDRGEVALKYGSLPLALLVLVGWGLRRRARILPGSWALDRLSVRVRAGMAVLAYLPFVAFAVPFALALSVWILVESFVWIEWYDLLGQLPEYTLMRFAPLFMAGTLLAGAVVLFLVLRRGPQVQGGRRRWWHWLIGLGVVLPVSLVVAPAFLGAAVHGYRLAPVLGNETGFRDACSSCHSIAAPLVYIRTPDDWRTSLESTCLGKSDLGQQQKDDIVDFLVGMRSFPDAWVFRTRCLGCHGQWPPDWEGRHPDDWKGIVDRAGRYSPHYYSPAIRTQLVRHVSDTWPGEGHDVAGHDASVVRATIRTCTTCHFMSRNIDAHSEVSMQEAVDLVRRMNERLPEPIGEAEVQAAADIWRSAARDPETMSRMVPHDRPVLSEAVDW
jgi:hypothetical protein